MLIRDARPGEGDALLDLQRRASDVWEEYREQLAAHPDAIALPDDARVRVAIREDDIPTGFAAVVAGGELDGLFVDPDVMGTGIGSALVDDAAAHARAAGERALHVIANPRAVGFYERVGFVGTGSAQTRFGPAVRMTLTL